MHAQYFHVFQHLAVGVEEVACAWGLMTASLPTAEALWVKFEGRAAAQRCSLALLLRSPWIVTGDLFESH